MQSCIQLTVNLNQRVLTLIVRFGRSTERLNVLYERNWTMLVHEQLRRFEGSIVAATRGGLIESSGADGILPRWTFSEALLYSVTVITTIGKCVDDEI